MLDLSILLLYKLDNPCLAVPSTYHYYLVSAGGPLYLVQDGTFIQVGITSFGSVFGCEVNMHAGFTRTAKYIQWIETNTGINFGSETPV